MAKRFWVLIFIGLSGCATKVGDIQRIDSSKYSVSARAVGYQLSIDPSVKAREKAISKAITFCEGKGGYLRVRHEDVRNHNAIIYFSCISNRWDE